MKNFIVQGNNKLVKTTGHKYKLSFDMKTCVSRLPSDTFILNPFSFVPFPEIEAMVGMNRNHLLDFIGQNRMKCTLFGESIDKVISFMGKPENEPVILVAQLFKPHFYLKKETLCWVVGTIVSIEVGATDWYWLNVVITDRTGCVNLIIWNQEAKLIMGKPAA
ncbi:uncharacterized protein [Arachis hypogaea]|uniref:uncharacterized protein n=1 Tax=Arachis hypogaea TaxID=3818 RepID=UPI000DED936A|nr:uncharacterized protein LOC112778019 [Arachis hypogaea]